MVIVLFIIIMTIISMIIMIIMIIVIIIMISIGLGRLCKLIAEISNRSETEQSRFAFPKQFRMVMMMMMTFYVMLFLNP